MQISEVREQMVKMLLNHWKGWVDEKIPALGGNTPRQAVNTADGRESVESLRIQKTCNLYYVLRCLLSCLQHLTHS
jgi:hypothetical protein